MRINKPKSVFIRKSFSLLISLLAFATTLNAQTMVYSITSNKKPLGQITVSKKQVNDLLKVEVVSQVNVKILINIDLKYNLDATYKNGELVKSSVSTFANGKPHSSSVTEKTARGYRITKDDDISSFLNQIHYSGAMLYWKEPNNVSKIYSEIDNIEKTIKKAGPGHYQLSEGKNKQSNDYYYQNGTLKKAVIKHAIMTFELNKM